MTLMNDAPGFLLAVFLSFHFLSGTDFSKQLLFQRCPPEMVEGGGPPEEQC